MKVKRVLISAAAIALVVVMLCGSAFAFNLTYQKVSLPDPYGIMPLSLNDDGTSRTFYNSKAIRVGYSSSSYSSLSAGTSISYSASSSTNKLWDDGTSTVSKYYYLYIPAGTYVDVSANVAFSSSEYQSLFLTGGGTYYLYGVASGTSTLAYPTTAQLLVNGSPVGSSVSCSNGSFTFTDLEVELTQDITTVGVRFTYSTAVTKSYTASFSTSGRSLYQVFIDNIAITPIVLDAVDYTPYLDRIIAWLQSIFSALNPIQSTLESIEFLLGSANDENSPVSRLANIFARDDDIQLRDDMDDTLKEATSVFYDDTENPSTAITTDTISQAGETLQGVSSMFDSGYSATDAFQEISDQKDDFMQWFTEETSSWLDSVPSTYSREDDPYNMWMIENQYAEMVRKRGEDN